MTQADKEQVLEIIDDVAQFSGHISGSVALSLLRDRVEELLAEDSIGKPWTVEDMIREDTERFVAKKARLELRRELARINGQVRPNA